MGTALYDQSKYKGWTIYMDAKLHVVEGCGRKAVFNEMNGVKHFSHIMTTDCFVTDDSKHEGNRAMACDVVYERICEAIDGEDWSHGSHVAPGGVPDKREA